ncbi:Arc family DNA-binding protein [Mesorhizobium sp. M1060]|uniref:Arc family DNA-binding protein n=1 Tax=Mesorhizobium sp. M1060 TaxID=2957052 RepID=UPI00333B8465
MSRTDPQVAVRLPPDVKAFLKAEAKENASSQNSEIVRALRASMRAKGWSSTHPQEGEVG